MKTAIVLVAVIALVLIGGVMIYQYRSATPALPTGSANGQINAPSSNTEDTAQPADTSAQTDEARVIEVSAARFTYEPSVIRVKKGEKVKLEITNTDTKHGMVIPDLGVSGIDSLEFTANEAGTYQFRCPTMCGSGHRNMTGTLIVE